MSGRQLEIICSECGADTLLVRTPVYDGLRKSGETLKCGACGHEYRGEDEIPYKGRKTVKVFDESDASKKPVVFREDEKGRLCRYCRHYVVNPFVQRCDITHKFVEATDTCARFDRKDVDAQEKSDPAGTPSKLKNLLG